MLRFPFVRHTVVCTGAEKKPNKLQLVHPSYRLQAMSISAFLSFCRGTLRGGDSTVRRRRFCIGPLRWIVDGIKFLFVYRVGVKGTGRGTKCIFLVENMFVLIGREIIGKRWG